MKDLVTILLESESESGAAMPTIITHREWEALIGNDDDRGALIALGLVSPNPHPSAGNANVLFGGNDIVFASYKNTVSRDMVVWLMTHQVKVAVLPVYTRGPIFLTINLDEVKRRLQKQPVAP